MEEISLEIKIYILKEKSSTSENWPTIVNSEVYP